MKAKSNEKIDRFFVRGNYPNKRSILSSMRGRLLNESAKRSSGTTPPVLELYAESGKLLRDIQVREFDIPFLCQRDFKKALAYVGLIDDARKNSSRAQKEIHRLVSEYYQEWKYFYRSIPGDGDEYVVPCTSSQDFSEMAIGDKGANLLRLSRQGFPVPDFVILTSKVYHEKSDGRLRQIEAAINNLERLTSQTIGSSNYPMIFAIRSAMPSYMPGIMPTYLNVGVTENSFPALVLYYGEEVAARIFLNNLKNMLRILDPKKKAALFAEKNPQAENLNALLSRAFDKVRKIDPALLQDAYYQTDFFIRQACKYFENNLDLLLTFSKGQHHYPSLILQNMICTVRNINSQVGVLYSRHPRMGDCMQIEYAKSIFGEEIMAGTVETEKTDFTDRAQIKEDFPAVYHFVPSLRHLERGFQSPVTIEFATDITERQKFFALLQLNPSEMTGRSAFISVMDLYHKGDIPQRRVSELIRPFHIKQIESDAIDPDSFTDLVHFCSGASILPRTAVTAQVFFDSEAALRQKKTGSKVCLCKKLFGPRDTVVMREMDAILSLTSAAIHVVTICQSYGLPGLLNLEKNGVRLMPDGRLINQSGLVLKEGDWVTLSSHKRSLYLGCARFKPARLIRYMKGESVELEENEREAFVSMATAYRVYNELIANLKLAQISSLQEIIRLVILEFRGETEKAKDLVNKWFDQNKDLYVAEVFGSEIGDHLRQHTVFNLLTLERKIGFFKKALQKSAEEKRFGYSAGTFMLGRFICLRQPVKFWKSFTPPEIGILISEWILFEKYMQLLHEVGERKITRAKKKILEEGLARLSLSPQKIKTLITLKLSKVPLATVKAEIPGWCDEQTREVIELLGRPYWAFFPPDEPWSVREFGQICAEERLPLPGLK